MTLLMVVFFNEILYNYVRSHVQGSLLPWSYFIVDIPTEYWVMHLSQGTSAAPLPAWDLFPSEAAMHWVGVVGQWARHLTY